MMEIMLAFKAVKYITIREGLALIEIINSFKLQGIRLWLNILFIA
jgi:hypothetical protein